MIAARSLLGKTGMRMDLDLNLASRKWDNYRDDLR